MKRLLFTLTAFAVGIATLPAQSFFTTPAPIFRTPAWRGTAGTEFSHWDVLYSPYNGINFPDFAAPNGQGALASEVGAIPPANANPGDPYAFWDAANPTLKQVLEPGAFIIGPGMAGNIYSPGGTTGYELADATPFTAGTVVLQWQTDGTLIDFATLRLVTPGGAQIAPANFITEYKSSGSSFGGTTNRTAAQWNLTGLGVTNYTIKFTASGSSTSMQEMMLDAAPTYTEAVASARTWAAASGNWSAGANWSGGTVGPVGGNIVIASGSGLTINGGTREIGELKLNAPGAFAIGASGGGILKVNTGITANAGSHTISAPYQIGSFNLNEIATGASVTLAGPVSGTSGFVKLGDGLLRLTANNSFAGTMTLDGGTLEISGTNAFTGTASVVSGRLILKGNAPGGSAGTLGNGSSTVRLGTGGTFDAEEAAVLVEGAFSVARAFSILNGDDPKKIGGQNTGAGAVFSGAVTLQSTAGALSLHAENANDLVTFTGAVSGGNNALTLTKTGAGRVVFSGANKAYLSDTIVSGGILEIAAGTAPTGTREVSVSTGAKLILRNSIGNLTALNIGAGGIVELSATTGAALVESDFGFTDASATEPANAIAVPEPSAAMLAVLGFSLLWRRSPNAVRKNS